ncbi:MAG TPA: hypothetical protein VF438_00090 [Candidatus Paceibacterota bacterium]
MAQGKKIPDNVWVQFIEALKSNLGSITHACHVLSIDRKSYYNKLVDDPKFSRKVQHIFETLQVPIAEEMLRADVLQRKAWAVRYTLDRASRKWHPKLSVEELSEFKISYPGLTGESEDEDDDAWVSRVPA